MLTELSKEQIELMDTVRDEWLAKIFDPKKRLKLDKKKAEKGIEFVYSLAGLKKPKYIVYVESPLAMQMAMWVMKELPKVQDTVGSSMESSVWLSVRSSVESSVRSSVESSVWSSVWLSVRSSVGSYTQTSYYSGIHSYGWCAHYDYFKRIGILKNENFDCFLDLLNSGIYDMIEMNDAAIVCSMPVEIHRTDVSGNMRLHNTGDFAIRWGDGYGQNYLWDVFFPDDLWQKVMEKNAEEILAIQNTEQRMAAMKYIGEEELLKSVNAELVSVERKTIIDPVSKREAEVQNELYMIPKGIFSQDAYFCKYLCPSTGRCYVSGVDPEIGKQKKANFSLASKFKLTEEEYLAMKIEA